ncbi:MAG: hypothetical protein DHS20C17_24660 [Cyclobacteriaceae bacterium]|nr:MAG: hypothetical protein DHS20C17_24660 [Cyclobacteriaceae bacterium]
MESDIKLLENYIVNHPRKAASIVEKLELEAAVELFADLPIKLSSGLLSNMDRYHAAITIGKIDVKLAGAILELTPRTVAVDLLRLLGEQNRHLITDQISPDIANELKRLLTYPKGTVGAHINPAVFTLIMDYTVEESMERVKAHAHEVNSYIYVLDLEKKLVGYVTLKDLIVADSQKKLQLIMDSNPPSLLADTSISDSLLNDGVWQGPFFNIPVVTIEGTFLGVVSKHHLSKAGSADDQAVTRQVIQAGSALGDLYQIGLSSLFRSS